MNLREFLARRFVGSIFAFVAGVLLALSFAPIDCWPFAFLAPAALLWLWDGAAPRRAAVLGFWFNAGTFTVGTYWLYISLRLIGHAPVPLALLLMASLVAIMGSYHALLGWATAKFFPARGALRWLLAVPAAWLLTEWWRSWFLTGFGWLALGYSQTETWMGDLAPVIGQYGIGYLVLLAAGALATLALGSKRERIAGGAVLAVLLAGSFGLRGHDWTQPFGQPITVAVVQGAVPQDEKWIEDNLPNIQILYRNLTRDAHGAKLIVWPESAVPELANNLVPYYRDVYQEASARGSALVLGTIRREENQQTGEGDYFNSVLAMARDVPAPAWYDKHHLVPFSEFFPVPQFVRKWLRLMDLPYSDFRRGAAEQPPLRAAGQLISASVCYEDAYGATQLHALRNGATLLVNVTNDSWFGHSTARYQHLQISRVRAQEAGRPMVRAANNGVSAVIGHWGEIIARAPEYEANVMRASLQPRIGLTPYAQTGNWPIVCLALVFSLIGAYYGRRGKTN